MSLSIEYDKQPVKFLKKLDKNISERIIDKIEEVLRENPVPQNVKAIVGKQGVFRMRIGKIRALYRIDYSSNKLVIFKLDKRERVYD